MSSSYTSPPESFFSSSYSSSSPLRLYNYIGGRFVPPVSAQYIDNLAPATSKVLTFIPRSSGADVELAVSAAKAAFLQWKNTSAEERAVYLDRIAALIESRLDSFARIEYEDTGKPYGLCKRLDIPRSISNFRYFGGAIRHDSTECHSMSDAFNYTTRSPVGIAGLITPWNLPLYLLSWKIAPALAMGNVIIAKPSELTPNTAAALAELVHEIGLPPGVFNLVHGYGYEVGEAIVAHPEIPLISFTGGTVTGRKVSSIAAPLFKKCSLELGGKNATVIFNDCDFDLTVAQTVRAAFSNQGQICLCGSRVFIEQGIYDKFIDAMVKQTQKVNFFSHFLFIDCSLLISLSFLFHSIRLVILTVKIYLHLVLSTLFLIVTRLKVMLNLLVKMVELFYAVVNDQHCQNHSVMVHSMNQQLLLDYL